MRNGPVTSAATERSRRFQALIWGLLCDGLCLVAGGLAFALTHHVLWIVSGVIAGLGFSGPPLIRFARSAKEQDRASR